MATRTVERAFCDGCDLETIMEYKCANCGNHFCHQHGVQIYTDERQLGLCTPCVPQAIPLWNEKAESRDTTGYPAPSRIYDDVEELKGKVEALEERHG